MLISANAFFVAGEFSLVACDRVRIEHEADAGSSTARRVVALSRRLSLSLASTQLGITVASLLLGFIAEPSVRRVLEPILGDARGVSVVVSLFLAAVFQTVLGEVVPKSVAITFADRTARTLAYPLLIFTVATRPVSTVFNGIANRVVRRFGVEPRDELSSTTSTEELQFLIRTSGEAGALDPEDVRLLTRTIRFADKTAADALIPRVQIEAVRRDASVADLVARVIETKYSRLPVYGTDLDDIVGVVHVKSIFTVPAAARATTPVTEIMGEVLAVPEGRDLGELFRDFRAQRSYLAVVVDEHGGTAGIITLEDVVEELVGEIGDEYDDDDVDATTFTRGQERGTFVVSGSLHPDEVLERCGFSMPEGEFETFAGFVVDQLGHVPETGERFEYDRWRFEVVAMDRRRVAAVRVKAPEDLA
ncbi:MAG: hemolysin family protein [Acidimicrobiales bacterium]